MLQAHLDWMYEYTSIFSFKALTAEWNRSPASLLTVFF